MSQHRHRAGKSAGCCLIFTHTSTPITFSCITSYQIIFSRSIFDRLEFLSHRTHALDYCSIILLGSSLRSRRFFSLFVFVIVVVIILLLFFVLLPFPAIFLFSLVYSLPLTPHFDRHLRNFTHYHWNDNGRGRKRISLVGG